MLKRVLILACLCFIPLSTASATECETGEPQRVDGRDLCCLEFEDGSSRCCASFDENNDCAEPPDGCTPGSSYVTSEAGRSDLTTCDGESCDGEGASIPYHARVSTWTEYFVCGADRKYHSFCFEAVDITYTCSSEAKECSKDTPRGPQPFTIQAPKVIPDGRNVNSNCPPPEIV